MTPKGLYLDSGSNDDVTWETGISGRKVLTIFGFYLHKYWTQQRYIYMLPKEKKKEVPKIVNFFPQKSFSIYTKIVDYLYKNSLLFIQK